MNKIIAFVLALSLALPFSSGAAFVPEEVEHSAEAEYVLEWADTALSDDESAAITYHFPLDTATYTTPFPLVGVAPHTSVLYGSYREWKTTAANTGYVEFPSPTKEIACEKYPYMVLQYTEIDKWFNVQFNLYNTWRPGNHNWYMATADKVVGFWIDITNVPESDNSYPFAGSFEVMQTSNQDSAAAASHRNI